MDKFEITRLCQQAENEYSAFLNELQKLEVAEYPTEASQDFILELRNEANTQKNLIAQRGEIASTTPGQLGDIKLEIDAIKAIRANLINNLMIYLDWVSGAQTRKVPWSFIPSSEDLAQRIIPERKVILYCENQYNYRIVWCENPVKKFQQYCFVSLPRLHRANILMHVWIGHELFHPLCKKFTEEKKRKAGENIAKTVREVFKDLKKSREIARRNDLLMIAWERALQEILCDIALGKIFGPAGLLAMRAFASFSDRRGKLGPETQFYPPWQYRFEAVWQRGIDKEAFETLLEKTTETSDMGKAGKDFHDEITEFGKTLESNEGFQYVMQDQLYKIAYTEVNNLLPEAAIFVDTQLPQDLPKWSDDNILNQVPKLVNRLLNGLPPNEIPNYSKKLEGSYAPEPAGVPAILTAGWIYENFRERAQGRRKKNVLDRAALSRLLLKACEDSEMLKDCH